MFLSPLDRWEHRGPASSCPTLCPPGPHGLQTQTRAPEAHWWLRNSGPPLPPVGEAGGAAWVGVRAGRHPPGYLPSYFLDEWTQARLPG